MPVVLEQPRMLHSLVSALPAAAGVAVFTLTRLLRAPPDQPNLPAAICNVVRCMEAVQLRAPHTTGILASLTKELSVAAQALTGVLELHQPAGMIGRVSAHRAWALCIVSLDEMPTAMLEAIGLEISRAYLCEDVFSANLAKKLYQAHQQLVKNSLRQDNLDKLENYVLSQCKCMQPIFSDRIKGLDAKTASFNNQVVASINSQTSSLRIEERQASGRIFEMSPSELTHVAIELKNQMEAGNARALQIALGFCIGLPWELALKVPFFSGTQCSAVAWINPGDKCVYVNLAHVLPALSKKRAGRHIHTALLLIRPLPLIVGNLVFEACAANPGLETVEDLAHESDQISRSILPGASTETAIRSSVARFIASRGGAALHAGVSRDTAAYTSLSLHLISKSDHHYLVKQRSDIWRGCDAVSSALNWGPCVPDTNVEGTAFGSRVTPQLNWVKEITDELRSAADLLRAGKRYSFDSLARHHNTYAAFVGLLMTILVGGRNRSRVEFCASTWGASCLFGQHGDKLIGPTRGLTPLPIPNTLLVQIQLWQVHLNALDRRLAKLNFKTAHPVRERIQAILRSDSVNLLFIINKDGAPDSLSTKSLFYGEGKSLNHDFSRHMMPGLLAKHDVPFEYVQWWLRHHVDGTSASATASTVIQQVWLSRVASALDRIALDLGLRPLHGIARTL